MQSCVKLKVELLVLKRKGEFSKFRKACCSLLREGQVSIKREVEIAMHGRVPIKGNLLMVIPMLC